MTTPTAPARAQPCSISPQAPGGERSSSMTVARKTRKPADKGAKTAKKFVWRKRDAQDSRLYNLQLDINDVKQQIQELTQFRQMLYARCVNDTTEREGGHVRTVAEYLRVFRHGLDDAPVDVVLFLHEIMAGDILVNDVRGGIDMILAQWRLYSACFARIDLRHLNSIVLPVQDSSGREAFIVRASAYYNAVLTESTIAIMFPHVLLFPSIVQRLVGRVLRGHSHYDFVFVPQSRRIVRCDVTLDFFSAFARLLPKPQDLSIVFNGARVESEFYIGEDAAQDHAEANPTAAFTHQANAPALIHEDDYCKRHVDVDAPSGEFASDATRRAEHASDKMHLAHILS